MRGVVQIFNKESQQLCHNLVLAPYVALHPRLQAFGRHCLGEIMQPSYLQNSPNQPRNSRNNQLLALSRKRCLLVSLSRSRAGSYDY
jgi:hypothetical protein